MSAPEGGLPPGSEGLDDPAFLEAFESCRLRSDQFHHRDHLRLAWLYVQRYPLGEALDRFAAGLRRLAAAFGKAALYHETITFAYLLLTHERIARMVPGGDWPAFVRENADLLTWRPSILRMYYSEALLESDLARRVFVWPDRCGGGA